MSGLHRIRLQAAWRAAGGGRAWTRSFGRPTGVGPVDRLWLVIERPVACVATLNGRPLPAVGGGMVAWRHDVTADVRERNELRLDFGAVCDVGPSTVRSPLPESLGLVALAIESGA